MMRCMRRLRGSVAYLLGLVLVVGAGCDSQEGGERGGSEESREPERVERPEKEPKGPSNPEYSERVERANEILDRIVETAVSHYREAGEPATFPGGAGVRWSSASEPPKKGASYRVSSSETADTSSQDASGDAGASGESDWLVRLGLKGREELPVQIVYETGEGTGKKASATLRAVADFAPSKSPNHTLFQELKVDPETGQVNVFPRISKNRWK